MTNENDYMIKRSDFTDLDEIFTEERVDYDQIVEDELEEVEEIDYQLALDEDDWDSDDDDTDDCESDGYVETPISNVDGSHLAWKLASFLVDHLRDMNVIIRDGLALNGKCGCFDVSVDGLDLSIDSKGFSAVVRFCDDDWELVSSAGSIPDVQEYNEMLLQSSHLGGWLRRNVKTACSLGI